MASSILKVGKHRIWLDPSEEAKLASAASRADVRKLISEGYIICKPQKVHSRYWANLLAAQKAKGRHRGPGKVRGTKNARMPEKDRWMQRIREIRQTLRKLRADGTISASEHKVLYMQAKGNAFRNGKMLMESIVKKHEELRRMNELTEQAEALKIPKILSRIAAIKAQKVALQLPDGLLKYAPPLMDTIPCESIVLADVVYGACCVDDTTAAALGCDLLIHFGHSCLIPVDRMAVPVLYVFVDVFFDVGHCLKLLNKLTGRIALMGTIQYNWAVRQIHKLHSKSKVNNAKDINDHNNKCVIKDSSNNDNNLNNRHDNCSDINDDIKDINDDIKDISSAIKDNNNRNGINDNIKDISNNGGTIKYINAIDNKDINKKDKKDNRDNKGTENIRITKIPQIKPLSPGEVLGCTAPSLHSTDTVFFIADGRFHLEAVMLRNPHLTFYRYCPFNRALYRESYDHQRALNDRKAAIDGYRKAGKVGLVRSRLQENSKIIGNVLKRMADKKVYQLYVDEIGGDIGDFEFIEAYVQVACPRLSIDWGGCFGKPLINSAELVCGEYRMDFYSKEEAGEYKH